MIFQDRVSTYPLHLDPLRENLLALSRTNWFFRQLWTSTEGEPALSDALMEFASSVSFLAGIPSFSDLNTPPFYAKIVALKAAPAPQQIGVQERLGGVWAVTPQDESRAIVAEPNVQILAARINGEQRYAPAFVGPDGTPFADHPAYPRWWFLRAFDACLIASLVFAADFDALYSRHGSAYAADAASATGAV